MKHLDIQAIEKDLEGTPFKVGGVFSYEHVRDGEVVDTWQEPNIIVDEGLNYILSTAFAGGTANTVWYVGLFKNAYTPIASNVAATFGGAGVAGEATTEYSETVRQTWTQAGVSAKVIGNSAAPAVFTFTTPVTINGAFLQSTSGKGATTGVLSAASKFSSSRAMLATDKLNITYTLTISSL